MALQTTTSGTPTGWAADARYQNYLAAQQIAGRPYQPYTGNMLAGWDQGQQQGYNAILNGGGIGQAAQAQAQQAALSAAQAGPQQVSAPGYDPFMAGVMNTPAASAGQATSWGVTNTHGHTAGPAATMNAASAGPASQMTAAQANLAQMQAAQMDRGTVRDIAAKNFLNYDINKYMNPYIGTVVNNSLKDLSRQNDIVNNTTNARAAAAGAFGGSRQAVANTLNNENYLRESGSLSGKLRAQGYDTASGLIMQDANRDLTAQQSNQQMDWNVGSLNTNNQQQAGMQNMLASNAMSQYNAGNRQAASQWNAGANNQMAQYNAGNLQQAGQLNQAALNNMAQYNTSNLQAANAATAAAHNAAAAQQAMNANQMAQFNAGNQQQANMATAQAHNAALANQAAARNAAGQFNADLGLRAGLANQSAYQNNINSRLTAANALNGMGMDEQTRAFNAANAAYRMGQNRTDFDQQVLNDQYRQWREQQDYPRNQLDYLNSALGNYSTGTTRTDPYYANTAANVLAGGIGAGQIASQLPQTINGLKSGYDFLSGMGWGDLSIPGYSNVPSALADTSNLGFNLLDDLPW